MECFRGRILLIALCFSLGTTRVQAGETPVPDKPSRVANASALSTASAKINSSRPVDSSGERVAKAAGDSAEVDVSDDNPADDSNSSAEEGDEKSAVAVNAENSSSVPRAVGDQDLITMNFQNVDLPVLAKFISEITGKNFVLDESVRGKVSIVSPTKVTPEQAYSIFKSVLQLKGFTTVAARPVIKIIPSRDSRGSAPLTTSQQPAVTATDAYVTRMIKLRNVDASSLVNVIQPMISRDGLVAAFPETNTLIVTDDAWNVQRLLGIIGSLDAQGIQQSVAVIPLKLAYADDLAPKIEQIMSERASGATSGYGRPGIGVVAPSAQAPSRAF